MLILPSKKNNHKFFDINSKRPLPSTNIIDIPPPENYNSCPPLTFEKYPPKFFALQNFNPEC